MTELQMFARVAGDNTLRQWLEDQKAAAVKVLVASIDPNTLGRAQGQYALADRALQLMEKARPH